MVSLRFPVLATILLFSYSWSDTAWAAQSEIAADQTTLPQSKYHDLDDTALWEIWQPHTIEGAMPSCAEKPLLSEMLEREAFSSEVRPDFIEASVNCALANEDMKEAYSYIKQWEALEGSKPLDASWVFQIAYLSGARDDALGRLEKIAQFEEPDELLESTDQFIVHVIRDLHREDMIGNINRLYNILMLSPHIGKLRPDVRSATAEYILGERLKSGKLDAVGELLAHITAADYYTEMLASRKYEPIWTEIEQRIGSNMGIVLKEYLQIESASHQANPQNKQIKQDYAHALLFAGQFEEVITLAQSIDHSEEAIPNWEEYDGWLLNLEAYAHDALGNTAQADRIFDSFITLNDLASRSNQKAWIVNFVINRASRLLRQGRWEEGLAAANIARSITDKSGTPYAKMLVRNTKACALHNLGRQEESLAVITEIETHLEDSLKVALAALLCVGEREQAAEIMVKGLANEKQSRILIETLQKPQFHSLYSSTQLPTIYSELRSHPDVAEAFDRVARSIPDRFIPLGGQRRHQLMEAKQAE